MTKGCLSLAVVGCGVWGMNHLRVWQDLGCLRMVYDTDPARLEAVRSRYPEAEIYSDLRAVLR
jgi:predicted dehydrogenase